MTKLSSNSRAMLLLSAATHTGHLGKELVDASEMDGHGAERMTVEICFSSVFTHTLPNCYLSKECLTRADA